MTSAGPGIGIVGLGFMGRIHLAAYRAAAAAGHAARIVAVADGDPERRTGRAASGGNLGAAAGDGRLFDPGELAVYADAAALFADDAVDLVSLCTPTDSHVHLTAAALCAGRHVLVEKPVALSSAAVQRLIEVQRASGRIAMPALCMRFWPGWTWLAARVADGAFGTVRSASFRRLGARPHWGGGFYDDPARCGGALFDLHVHDADFVLSLFGMPASVSCTGHLDHVVATYRFAAPAAGREPFDVRAEGGWDASPGAPFRMGFRVVFDDATAEYDSTRGSPLRVVRAGREECVPLPAHTGYDGEVRHLLDVLDGRAAPVVTLDDALSLTRLLEAERRSLDSRTPETPGAW